MKTLKKVLLLSWIGVSCLGLYMGYRYLESQKEQKRRDAYYQNLQDTASPTVSVLRDSLLIPYQNVKRTVHIYVPPEYAQDTTIRYPVIYLLDGESSFNDLENNAPEWQVDEVINKASQNGHTTAIVIGINQAENRDAEYTPFINEENPDAHGDKFAAWVANDLKNWVDTHFRTLKNASATTIGGISRSGMMAYYMLMSHPSIFGNAIIQSPAMWVDYDKLMNMQLAPNELRDKKIFISVGAKEGNIMVPHAKDIFSKFSQMGLDSNALRMEIIPKEGHWHLTWRKSFAIAYPWLFNY